jgi:GAF domain-containing protein
MQDVWVELWPALEAIAQRALAGQTGFFENFPVEADRFGRPGRRWFTLTFAPVHDDEARVSGLMCMGNETTEHVLRERHHAFQLRLSDHLRGLSDAGEITAHAARLLGLHLGMARVGFVDVDETRQTVSTRPDWTNGELPSLAGRTMTMDDFGAAAIARLRLGRTLRVNDSTADDGSAAFQAHGPNGARSMLAVPLFKNGALSSVLHVHGTHSHPWSDNEVMLALETAERTWDAVERANADERRRLAEEELHRNAARQAFQLELSDLLRSLTDPHEIVAQASGLLGSRLGVSRVLYAEVDDASGIFEVRHDWTQPGVVSVACHVSKLDDFGPEIIEALRSGIAVSIDDVEQDARTGPHAAAYASVGVRAFLTVPLVRWGRLHIVLMLHQAQPFQWTQLDLQRTQDMAERTWSCVEAARAQAALRMERDRTKYVLDSMGEGFAMLGPDCTLLQMNAEGLRIGRLTQSQVIGRKAGEVWPKAAGTVLGALYREVKATGQAGSLEFKRTLPEGRVMWLEIRAFPVLGGGIAVFYRDISKRKLAEE